MDLAAISGPGTPGPSCNVGMKALQLFEHGQHDLRHEGSILIAASTPDASVGSWEDRVLFLVEDHVAVVRALAEAAKRNEIRGAVCSPVR